MSKRYGVGIIGNCCTHGEFVAFALKQEPEAIIVAGWEDDPRRTAGLSAATGLDLAPSPDALLEDPAIDIIALACSPHQKAAWVEKAARAGKHIFLNKPMAENLDSARRIERQWPEHRFSLSTTFRRSAASTRSRPGCSTKSERADMAARSTTRTPSALPSRRISRWRQSGRSGSIPLDIGRRRTDQPRLLRG